MVGNFVICPGWLQRIQRRFLKSENAILVAQPGMAERERIVSPGKSTF